ncbi:helix-turn-helix domain-containing protein [Nitrospirillum pindoramense]|uniref:Helix-turn-helix protein n=1 Tax=Nitrospirillum amazonense TaxID=28077 RepID=A0A560H8P0_9PROT|nr:helix-turn-helix domain-containing protein [Nitrospirillum amazonense]TWB41860.1 helix-turn-helix protein [Nitrospirillum amazonense]
MAVVSRAANRKREREAALAQFGAIAQDVPDAVPLDGPGRLGALIRARRQALGMTLRDVAAGTGLSLSFLSAVENGKPTAELGKVMAYMQALGIDLFGGLR